MTSRVDWNQDQWERDTLHPAIAAGLKQAAIVAQVGMRRGMGSEGGGVLRKATKRKKGGKFVKNSAGKGRNVYYAAPPGAYPGVRTGFLRRAIVWWRPRSVATGREAPFVYVGVPGQIPSRNNPGLQVAEYAEWLEHGTGRMAARPWAMKTIIKVQPAMDKAFARGAREYMRGTP